MRYAQEQAAYHPLHCHNAECYLFIFTKIPGRSYSYWHPFLKQNNYTGQKYESTRIASRDYGHQSLKNLYYYMVLSGKKQVLES